MADPTNRRGGVLDWIERIGNRLPDPMTLFIIGALAVVVISQIADSTGWQVEKTVLVNGVKTTETVEAFGLLSRDGFFWAIESMVDNFVNFPPLGVVLVGMLGIGVAEKTGCIGAMLKAFMLITPQKLLTPSMVFIGVMSSMALDAGYVVLPPVAAALYKAVGRSPLVGLAAVFSGVAAGFSANLLPTGLDPLLAGFTQAGANILDQGYVVAATCNWWFMIASTIMLTFVGWAVTAFFVEPRYENKPADEGGPTPATAEDEEAKHLTPDEKNGLKWTAVVLTLTLVVVGALIFVPGAPLHTFKMPDPVDPNTTILADLWQPSSPDEAPPANALVRNDGTVLVPSAAPFSRWVVTIVPLLFIIFLMPGVAYGIATGAVKADKDTAKLMANTMADMGPYIVLAFFAGQFVAYFAESHLGEMLAITGGSALAASGLPTWALIAAFIVVVMLANLFIGSASGKYAFLAPVFVPMFMQVGISPELTQAAYRVGDSCSNTIAPLNPYIIIILVFMQRYVPKAGIGTLVSLMLPYTITVRHHMDDHARHLDADRLRTRAGRPADLRGGVITPPTRRRSTGTSTGASRSRRRPPDRGAVWSRGTRAARDARVRAGPGAQSGGTSGRRCRRDRAPCR